MLGEHEFSDGAVHYTDAYSAYGPIVAGKSGIWWFTLRNRWDPGARYMPAEREVLHTARDRHQHWELTTEAVPSALLGELCQATEISCRPVLEAEDGLAGWRYRIPPCTAIAGPAPGAGGGQFGLVLTGDAAVDGGDPLPTNSCISSARGSRLCRRLRPPGAELLCLQFRRRARIQPAISLRSNIGGRKERAPQRSLARYADCGLAPPEAKNPAKSSGCVSKQRSPSGSVSIVGALQKSSRFHQNDPFLARGTDGSNPSPSRVQRSCPAIIHSNPPPFLPPSHR